MSDDMRAVFFACIVLGAVLATLVMGSGCGAPQRLAMSLDGYQRELMTCDAVAEVSEHPGASYDACMRERGL